MTEYYPTNANWYFSYEHNQSNLALMVSGAGGSGQIEVGSVSGGSIKISSNKIISSSNTFVHYGPNVKFELGSDGWITNSYSYNMTGSQFTMDGETSFLQYKSNDGITASGNGLSATGIWDVKYAGSGAAGWVKIRIGDWFGFIPVFSANRVGANTQTMLGTRQASGSDPSGLP